MKRKSIFVIGSVLAAGLLVGSTFAAWAVTDKADPFNVGITPGTISDDENDSVTLEWGSRELVKVENLSYQEEKGPYKVGLKATTGSGEGFTGNLVLKFTFQGEVAPQLLNYLYVKVYDGAKGGQTAPTLLLTLDKNSQGLTANKDLDVTSGQVRDVYFYIGLKGIENPAQYDALKNDVVNLQVDWNKGSQVEEITSRTYYFKNTEEWAKVYAYAWLEEDGSTNAEWPGLEMKNAKDDIFALDIPVKYDKIIFNNGLGEQTDDLTVVADKPYWDGAKWDVAPSSGEITEVEYYLVGTMNDWKAVEGYKLVQDPENENKYSIKDLELEKDAKMKVLDPAKGDDGWFSNASDWEGCGFTLDGEGNVVLSAAGTYDIDFYVVGDNNNHIVPNKHAEPVPPQPEPEEAEFKFTWEQDYVWTAEAKVYAWVWGGEYEDGQWVEITKDGDLGGKVTLMNDAAGIKMGRFTPETAIADADWESPNLWNQTDDINFQAETLAYVATWH